MQILKFTCAKSAKSSVYFASSYALSARNYIVSLAFIMQIDSSGWGCSAVGQAKRGKTLTAHFGGIRANGTCCVNLWF